MNPITVTSQNDFSRQGSFFIISAPITLTSDLQIGDVTIEFQGGQIILDNYTLTFNNTIVIGSDYILFESQYNPSNPNTFLTNISGTLGNAEINADWFGAAVWLRTAKAINKALSLCQEDAVVVLPQRRYYIHDKIILSKRRIGLKCPGYIVSENSNDYPYQADCAIELQAEQLRIDIRSLECYWAGNELSAVLFSGNVYNSDINIDRIITFDKGLNFSPTFFSHNSSTTEYYAGSQYNKISWQLIDCNTGIYINLWPEENLQYANDTNKHRVWVNENYFFGGRIKGVNGIITETEPLTQEGGEREDKVKNIKQLDEENLRPYYNHQYYIADYNNGNVFENISFDAITDCAVNLYRTQLCRFYDIRMPANLSGITHVIAIDKCAYINFHFKGYFNLRYLSASNSTGITVDALIVDDNYSLISEDAQLEVVSQNPPAFETNPCSKFVARRRCAISALTQRTFSATQTINLLDLFGTTQGGDTVMTNVCDMTLHDNVVVTVETSGINRAVYPMILINATIGTNSHIEFSLNESVLNAISASGSYIISFLFDTNNLQLIRL